MAVSRPETGNRLIWRTRTISRDLICRHLGAIGRAGAWSRAHLWLLLPVRLLPVELTRKEEEEKNRSNEIDSEIKSDRQTTTDGCLATIRHKGQSNLEPSWSSGCKYLEAWGDHALQYYVVTESRLRSKALARGNQITKTGPDTSKAWSLSTRLDLKQVFFLPPKKKKWIN